MKTMVLITRIMGGEFYRKFQHILAEKCHPGRAIRLLQVAAGWQRGTAVENTDIIKAQEPTFKYIFAKPVFPVYPPGKIQQSLLKADLQKFDICFTLQRLFRAVQK